MTAPAPSPEPQEKESVEMPKTRRSMLTFYVGTGVVCLLLVGFYFVWTPLKVQYAMYQVGSVTRKDVANGRIKRRTYCDLVATCRQAAARGNRPALAVLMSCPFGLSRTLPRTDVEYVDYDLHDMRFLLAARDPGFFFLELRARPETQVLNILDNVSHGCIRYGHKGRFGNFSRANRATTIAGTFERFAHNDDERVSLVARAALDFMRQRFSSELAAARSLEETKTPSTSSGQAKREKR